MRTYVLSRIDSSHWLMRPKTITLCLTTHEISKKIPNFSKWVREQILNYDLGAVKQKKQTKELMCKKCNSFIECTWEQFTDGTYAWYGYCPSCKTNKTWTPKRWLVWNTIQHYTTWLQTNSNRFDSNVVVAKPHYHCTRLTLMTLSHICVTRYQFITWAC